MPTVLIAGASRGIGLELARQYAAEGWNVHATTRTPTGPGELGTIEGVRVHRLEVRCAADATALADELAGCALDLLIHNAGVSGTGRSREEVFAINSDAPFMVTEALFSNLLAAQAPKLVLMTSQLGARRGSTSSLGLYGDSKAALNDRFRALAPTWRAKGVSAIVLHPGWVRTDMGGHSAPLGVEQSVHGIRQVVASLTLEATGKFLTWEGNEHPW